MDGYATTGAVFAANRIGLNLSLSSWREIFLAITDQIAGETLSVSATAEFVGKVRDGGERWHIKMQGRAFDVIYDPHIAKIILVIRPPREPAVLPNPTPELTGGAARILADAN